MALNRKVEILDRTRLLDDFFVVEAAKVSFEKNDGTMSLPKRLLNFERGDGVAAVLTDLTQNKVVLIR
ncbi:MAG: hypothetical protein ACLFUU_10650 [Desulfobacteraceae bacterium]